MPAVPRFTAVSLSVFAFTLANLSLSACESGESAAPVDEPERDAARAERDAGHDGGRDAGRDASSDARVSTRDAKGDEAPDARVPDQTSDAGADCVEFTLPAKDSQAFKDLGCAPPMGAPLPRDLRCTGLYANLDERVTACNVLEYKPALELWSDAAEKRRWVSLPKGTKVDVSDPNDFVFPAGTQFWKEFRVQGSDGAMRLAETRLLRKTDDGWLRTSYVWSEDQSEAIQMDNALGVPNLYGTGHTVPNRDQCADCHVGRKDEILGWDALMLGPGATGLTREKLVELDMVEGGSLELAIPGNEIEKAALGYMHANCGVSCHNETAMAKAKDTGLYLRLEAGELDSVQTTDAFKTSFKRPAENAKYEGLMNMMPEYWYDIRPGDPARSLMIARQTMRGTEAQMPRIGTNKVDDAGVQAVTRWIESMTRDAGYPAPMP